MGAAALGAAAQTSEIVNVQGKDYEMVKLLERRIGPGTVYTRYRLPQFPLNLNMVTVDLTNPYLKIETSLPGERSAGTELLTAAAERYDAPEHHAIAAQNGNFWIISSQPQWNAYNASPHGVTLRNGMLSSDSKSLPHWWWWTSEQGGLVSISDDNTLYIDLCRTEMSFTSERLGTRELQSCNKGFKRDQAAFYTPYFGEDRGFLPLRDDTPEQLANNDIHYDIDEESSCTEVLLDIDEGESWMGGKDIRFTVAETRQSNGRGTLGTHSLAIVQRNGEDAGSDLRALVPGDKVTLNYSWVFDPAGEAKRPHIEQAVGGNILVMRHGEITEQNYWDSYNTMVYSRSAYGSSADGKTLYMIVIDKSNDVNYGISNGCTTAEMCDIVRGFGVYNLMNVDAGGSAELMVQGRIINKTTEGSPRAVGNGWMLFNTAPDGDSEVAALEFEDVTLRAGTFTSFTPQVIAYNKYGTVVDYDYRDFTISCDATVGQGDGSTLLAGTTPVKGTVTATAAGGASVTKEIEIVAAEVKPLTAKVLLDVNHPYSIELVATVGGKEYPANPARAEWSVADAGVATVDAEGTLRAVANGTTTLTGKLGTTEFAIEVTVENPVSPQAVLTDDWSKWKVKGASGLNDVNVDAGGNIGYTYKSPRGNSEITLTLEGTLYGLPESIEIDFEHSLPTDAIVVDLPAAGSSRNLVTVSDPSGVYAQGARHTVTVPMSMAADPLTVSSYPFKLRSVKFQTRANSSYAGAQTLKINGIRANYNDGAGVESVAAQAPRLAITPNPVAPGEAFAIDGAEVEIYTPAGMLVGREAIAPATPGLYIVRTSAGTAMLVVK